MKSLDDKGLVAFTDGSSLGNPGPGGWGVVLVYPRLGEVIELGGTKLNTTNNEMELTAIVSALSYAAHNDEPLRIYSDSKYAIQGVTEWMYDWARNGWKTASKEDVKNQALWKTLYQLVEERGPDTISWHHVRGHVGIPGNERVDDIARLLAEGTNVKLYRGSIDDYSYPDVLTEPPADGGREAAKKKSSSSSSAKAYSYLSLVDGILQRHATWADCEARVKGNNAKFKKALSKEHEDEIIAEWGM